MNTYLIESPLCDRYKLTEETPYHIILECSNLAEEARRIVSTVLNDEEISQDSTTLLNASRSKDFIKVCLEILSQHSYRDHIELNNWVV